MPVMVDTQILIYALHSPQKKDSEEKRRLCSSAKNFLQKQPRAYVSVLSVLETLRGIRAEAQDGFASMLSRLDVKVVTAPIAIRAHEILKARGLKEKTCPRCLNSAKSSPCGKCNSLISRTQKLNDALIVATADYTPDVDILYTNDKGMLQLSSFVKEVKICRIPIDVDGPLFDRRYAPEDEHQGPP